MTDRVDELALRKYMLELLKTRAPSGVDIRSRETRHDEILITDVGRRDYKVAISTLIAANGGQLGQWPRDWADLPVDDLIPYIFRTN